MQKVYKHTLPFELESSKILPEFELTYHTFGKLNSKKDNVVWVCHALTANSNPLEWWDVLIGEGKIIDPKDHFIICANILGSCYGSTNALSVNPKTNEPYYHTFPKISIRDIVKSLNLLRQHLNIEKIKLCLGGSMGGQQAMEWAIIQPDLIQNLALIATNARHSAWGIAFNESQRMAIKTDITWKENHPKAGLSGMKTARSIALLSYRNYETYGLTQTDNDEREDDFSASSYQNYQGEKLAQRFDAFAYYNLSKTMDSHHVGRNRGGLKKALSQIKAKASVVSISNDVLFPSTEQELLAQYIPFTNYSVIHSTYGHDGFLLEGEKISAILENDFDFLSVSKTVNV